MSWNELQAKTEAAEAKLPEITGTGSLNAGNATVEGRGTVEPSDAEDDIEEVLREAARSPKLGLMLLSAKIERAARELAGDTGLDVAGRPAPLIALIRYLLQAGQIAVADADALILFNQVRNRDRARS